MELGQKILFHMRRSISQLCAASAINDRLRMRYDLDPDERPLEFCSECLIGRVKRCTKRLGESGVEAVVDGNLILNPNEKSTGQQRLSQTPV